MILLSSFRAWYQKVAIMISLVLVTSSCGIYSFTGTALSPDIKSFHVKNFLDRSGRGPANLSQKFSEKLRDYVQSNSSLGLVQNNGDLQFEGQIVGYVVTPIAPTAQEVAERNRLTITVQVKFVNKKDEEQNFDQQFSFYSDFSRNQQLTGSTEQGLNEEIISQIVLDVFNKSVANW